MKKTVSEWLSLIADPTIRGRAIANFKAGPYFEGDCNNVNAAISSAFWWVDSPEGHDYWEEISDSEIQLFEDYEN